MIINFLSCDEVPQDYRSDLHPMISLDDGPLVEALEARGAQVRPIDWKRKGPRDIGGDVTLIRSRWNYHRAAELFRRWIEEAVAANLPLLNAPDLVLRTIDKRYLLELQDNGVSVVSTQVFDAHKSAASYARGFRSDRLIVKPVVGASSQGIYVVGKGDEWPGSVMEDAEAGSAFLVQPFLPEIANGEVSIIILDGTFSHAVRKVPAKGDFRVQYEYGGRNNNTEVSDKIVAEALRASRFFGEPLYARVDGVIVRGVFRLMELEMIEPELYLTGHEHAADRLADLVVKKVST